MSAAAVIASVVIGIFCGVFAGRDGTRFLAGLAYAISFLAAILLLVFGAIALMSGEFLIGPFLLAVSLLGTVVLAAFAIAFAVVRRFTSRPVKGSGTRAV